MSQKNDQLSHDDMSSPEKWGEEVESLASHVHLLALCGPAAVVVGLRKIVYLLRKPRFRTRSERGGR
jgi:hypothetical protein